MPTLTVIAGPNGAGKSTLTLPLGPERIDPDAIAWRMNPTEPARAAVPAAREAILRCRATGVLQQAVDLGYFTFLIYVSLSNPELHTQRVRLRASQGGHDIPDSDIYRRYKRSLLRAPQAIRPADRAVVLDNSGLYPTPMLSCERGRIIWKADPLAKWVRPLADSLSLVR